MIRASNIVCWVIRVVGLVLVGLGLLFWSGNALDFINLHMLLGLVLVIALWVQAFLAARLQVSLGLVVMAVIWGLIVLALGITQTRLLPGDWHWLVKVLHLVVGIVALAIADTLAKRITQGQEAQLISTNQA